MDPESPYRPIACSLYDLFEAAALHQRTLQLRIDGNVADYVVRDVFSRGKEEFLVGVRQDTGELSTIRLDRIDLVIDPTDKKSYFPSQC